MKILSPKGLNVITAIILTILTAGVICVCFIPSKVVLISGGKTYAPIYGGDRTKNNVAIMINVYENSEIVEKMLDVFQEKGAKATFFIGGCWADDNVDVLIKILEKEKAVLLQP